MKQFLKKCLFMLVSFIVGSASFSLSLNAGMQLSQEDLMNMSPEEMSRLQEEINHQIEAEIAKMSPEEQAQFFDIMANVEKMASEDPEMLERFIKGEMSKDEESAFVNAMVPESEEAPVSNQVTPKEAVSTPEKKEEAPKLNAQQLSTEQLLGAVVSKTETFLVKMQSYPEIAIKIRNWIKNRSLVAVAETKQWTDVEKDINGLIQKITVIVNEKNSSKKAFLVNAVAQNDALLSSLKTIVNALTATEKEITIPLLGVQKVAKPVKEAIQKTMNSITTELYSKDCITLLDSVLKSYEAEDKKIKEKEEATATKAGKEGQAPRQKAYMKSAGKEKEPASARRNYDSGYDSYRPSYRPSGGRGSYDDYDSYDREPSRASNSSRGSTGGGSGRSSAARRGPGASTGGAAAGHDHDHAISEGAQTRSGGAAGVPSKGPQKGTPTPAQPARKKKDPKQKLLDALEALFSEFEELIAIKKDKNSDEMALNSHFDKLSEIISSNELDIVLATELLPQAVRMLTGGSKSIMDMIKTLGVYLSKESNEVKADYREKVSKLYDLYLKKIFDLLIDRIGIVTNSMEKIEAKASFINQYAFLGKELPMTPGTEENPSKPATSEAEKALEQIPSPTTIFKLKEEIEKVKKEIATFVKGTVGTK